MKDDTLFRMKELDDILSSMGITSDTALWITQIFVVVLLTLLANLVAVRGLNKLQAKLAGNGAGWDDVIVDALKRPLAYLVWLVGLLWAVEIVRARTEAAIFDFVGPARDVGVVFIIAWAIVRLVNRAEQYYRQPRDGKQGVDETTVNAVGKLVRISVIITAALVMLQTLGYSISGVLAFGGIGGIAIGFAAKDLLANFFGGLMIYMDRPFAVGEWIRSPDKDIEGTVEDIGWRLTRIRTFDKRPLYVPNSTFMNIAVENPSRMTNRRIKETVGIRYVDGAKMAPIVEDVKTMLREHPEIDTNQTLIVNFNAFNASSLDFFIYTFTKTTNWVLFHEIKQDVLLKVMEIIERHGADIAFPTRTLHVADPVQVDMEKEQAAALRQSPAYAD